MWGSLNLVFVSGDLFTLYVALELLTFAGVPLVSLGGQPETLRSALRYLLYALFGSVLYLLGAVLLYGAYGTLDISLLAARVHPEPVTWKRRRAVTVGLLAKTALFPLHLWLPPARGRTGGSQRRAIGPGDQGLVVSGRAALARRIRGRGDLAVGTDAGGAGRGGHSGRQYRRAPTGAAPAVLIVCSGGRPSPAICS
ncbi:MAG: proton-conducting transporter membrane subunit [Candidatus Competibacteraceae bacterium]